MNKRKILIAIAAGAMLMTSVARTIPAPAPAYAAGLPAESQVLDLVNQYRTNTGLAPLKRSPELDRAAAVRAQEIAQRFSHTRPDGSSWSTVSAAAYGENIAKGHRSAERAMLAWMNSQGHRANILRGSYGSIGIAAVSINGTMYWVQLFGR